jgi:hypothetical protein
MTDAELLEAFNAIVQPRAAELQRRLGRVLTNEEVADLYRAAGDEIRKASGDRSLSADEACACAVLYREFWRRNRREPDEAEMSNLLASSWVLAREGAESLQ